MGLNRTFFKVSKFLLNFFLIGLVSSAPFFSFAVPTAYAVSGSPAILNHQGRLLDSSGNLLGGASGTNYCFRFSFYEDETVGAPDTKLWPTGTPSKMTALVKNGIFNVAIGDTNVGGDDLSTFDFNSTDTTYLNIEVAESSGGSCAGVSSFENLSPRQRMSSAAYALNANSVGGFTPSQTPTGNQIPALTSGNLQLAGNVLAGGLSLSLGSDATGDLFYRNSSGNFERLGVGFDGQVLSAASGLPSWTTLPGGGDALVADPLSQFAATTSLQLSGVISDETGSGALVFSNSPVFTTPNIGNATGSISGNAGTVTNGVYTTGAGTVFLAPNGSAAALTSFPTFNQNTTGSAATLTTPRTIFGVSFDGSANIGSALGTGAYATIADYATLASPTFTGTVSGITAAMVGAPTGSGTSTGTNTGDQTTITGNAGTATALATARAIYGNNFDGTAALTQIIASTYGGTGNGFTKFTGPTTSEKTFTLPDASATLLYAGGALGTPSSGVATNLTGTASGLSIGGNAGTVTNGLYTTDKDATGGVPGLTLFKINFKNAANTFTNYLTNSTTDSRTYTFPDATGTVALTSDITGTNSGTNTGDVTLGAIGSSANANGASLSGQVLNLQPASASFGGVVTTGTQTFAGAKTFSASSLELSSNQNGGTFMSVKNTTSGTDSYAGVFLTSTGGNYGGQLYKLSGGYTTYKTLAANDLGFYNTYSGNISILNDYTSGNINFTAGGASTPQLVVTSAGYVAVGGFVSPSTAFSVKGQTLLDSNGKDMLLFNSAGSNYGTIQNDAANKWSLGTGTATNTLGTPVLTWTSGGLVGIGASTPTAVLQLKAGTATASTAPLKFTSGTNLTTAEAGAVEYDGTQLYFSPSTTRNMVAQVSGSTAMTAGSVAFATTSGYLTQDNTNFFWDDTNNRLGIGTASPSFSADIVGTLRVAGAGTAQTATGGTITTSGGYTIHTFTSGGTFTPAQGMSVEYLVVAGGGGGGAGGGGAGGMLTGSTTVTATPYTITVGAGGAGGTYNTVKGSNGNDSVFSSVTATGGGGGAFNLDGSVQGVGNNGGSGGGGAYPSKAGGTGTGGQGSSGGSGSTASGYYATGGGGGAGGAGANGNSASGGGAGGAGSASSISGSSVTYAGGGGGGADVNPGTGGSGGGGAGVVSGTPNAGTANTGGGGGGNNNATGGAGGSGVVIIRYLTTTASIIALANDSNGRVGIGTISPTAYLHLPAGSATANYAPLKFTSGTNLTTPEAGAMEFNGTSLLFSPSTTRYNVLLNNYGLSGGQTIVGDTASAGNLTLSSTSHATKGKIVFGTSAYDEANNRLGIGTASPTAVLQLKAGTATASTAPLKFTSGTNLTTAEAGAVEYDGTQLYFSPANADRNILLQNSTATAFTAGSVAFATTSGYLTQDNTNFFWDDTNNRLGIGTASPTYTLDTVGIMRIQANTGTPQLATGGTITTSGAYTIHTFTSSGTFTPSQSMNVEYLVVAGGGGGGTDDGGAGGAGGYQAGSGFAVTAVPYTITVGAGGVGQAFATRGTIASTSGSNSVFSTVTATGGGRGGNNIAAAANGGSGGSAYYTPGNQVGTGSQGGNGGTSNSSSPYSTGGGGGAGGAGTNASGSNAGAGGPGIANSISGSSVTYAGGGGGSSQTSLGGVVGAGGSGGGGAGAGNTGNGVSGTANTGGGGGGAVGGDGGSGGSGIVIIRYLTNSAAVTSLASDSSGNIGIGTITPSYNLSVSNTGTAGIVGSFTNSDGTCTLDPGNVSGWSCPSDRNLKKDIANLDGSALDQILKLQVVNYRLRNEDESVDLSTGLIAQDVQLVFPKLVGTQIDGTLSLNYGGLTPYLIKAVQELDLKITDIENFATAENTTFLQRIIDWLASAANGITDLFAKRVRTQELCVGEICLNEDQIREILNATGTSSSSPPVVAPEPETDPGSDTEPESEPEIENPGTEDPVVESDPIPETDPEPEPPTEETPPEPVVDPVIEPAPAPDPAPENPPAPAPENAPTTP